MTNYETLDFTDLLAISTDGVVTHSLVRDVTLPSGNILALVTLDNGIDHTRPNTLGPHSLLEFDSLLVDLAARARNGEIQAVGITGKPYILAAGADLSKVQDIPSVAVARKLSQLGHRALGRLAELGVPSFVFINGLALGGGLEIALNATYRTVDASAPALALPETFLGLVPGWGGAFLLPNLVGIENALKIIIENPLKSNRMMSARDARDLGVADVMFDSVRFLEDSLQWADGVLGGTIKVKRPHEPSKAERLVKWDIAIKMARSMLETKLGTVAKAPYVALDLMSAAKSGTKADGFAREDEALATLIAGDQFSASIYAFNLVQKRAKRPAGAPDRKLARPVTKVGIIGAGLMARQFALLFVRRLQVPVLLTDINQERLDLALAYIHDQIATLKEKGRIGDDEAKRLNALVSTTTNLSDFSDADWVIEAIFEELTAKQDVFADVEKYAPDSAIFATNTSSLSVDAIGSKLLHPERLVGFHFFNPVAVMPLLEVVRASKTDDAALATAMDTAKALQKSAVITTDSPGFVVNRLLARLLGEAMHAIDNGTPLAVIDGGLKPFGLPMTPCELLELVGLKVGAHVLDTHYAAFPDRFYRSDNLHALADHGKLLARDKKGAVTGFDKGAEAIIRGGSSPITQDEFRVRVEDGLADEIHRMLDEKVVVGAEDIDLCMILGAGWPFQMGGVTPYLDRVGASQRAFGGTFHTPLIRGVV
ncbi:3-hydroxyacyl-CoA dehydrogenase NAD-binding domain-containing protein [Alpinimonas psychrophila]|uniref:3-hydroxyacyl-CoA dehydrogenase/enoyl-CoA hydratase/carnithine racemase n=1 Tax=Alpinimonas psychrophila TaxID=748908 RepID=A0A7W3PNU1_9MICO|nr:3-hydroxyacyl-CoA dehydrogenase NAD-binding domain-containing protein [Alpinimonas psychrophila]MBA8828558.1 3-hydroxyacyl-CoA dehydrogenase/enoyl-CoA hydratase/carnithine racemase [Alpinimonas psychrophila]